MLVHKLDVPVITAEAKSREVEKRFKPQQPISATAVQKPAPPDTKGLIATSASPAERKTRAKAAALAQVSRYKSEQAASILKTSPALANQVASGAVSLKAAAKQLQQHPHPPVPEPEAAKAAPADPPDLAALKAAYAAHKPLRDLARDIQEIARRFDAIKECRAFVSEQEVHAGLKSAAHAMIHGAPYAVCPYCHGQKTDKLCRDQGWLTKWTFDSLPREMKIAAVMLKD
jgi:glutamine synthetase adenylyltransferase